MDTSSIDGTKGKDEGEQLKLELLRRLADEAFEELDRGEFEVVQPGELDQFMAKVDAMSRERNPCRS